MNSLDLTLNGITRALDTSKRVDAGAVIRDWAGIYAAKYDAIGRIGSALTAAAYGQGRFGASITENDFRELEAFVAELRFAFNTVGVLRRDDAVDQQFSPDGYSHYLDQEKL